MRIFFVRSVYRNYLQKILEKVLREVRYNRRFDRLQEEINNIAKKQEDEHNLEVNEQIWRGQAEQLRELLESDKKANEEDRKRTAILDHESDAQIDHEIFLSNAKLSKCASQIRPLKKNTIFWRLHSVS